MRGFDKEEYFSSKFTRIYAGIIGTLCFILGILIGMRIGY